MPNVLRTGPYRIYFYSHEPNEPAYVHVEIFRLAAKPVAHMKKSWKRRGARLGFVVATKIQVLTLQICSGTVTQFQPRSRGLPVGLLDQPLYGWVQDTQTKILQPVSTGFVEEALAVMLKRLIGSTLKRADSLACPRYPALKALVYEPFGKAV